MMHLVPDTPTGLTDKDSHFPPTAVASTLRPLVMTDFAVVGQLIQFRNASLAASCSSVQGFASTGLLQTPPHDGALACG